MASTRTRTRTRTRPRPRAPTNAPPSSRIRSRAAVSYAELTSDPSDLDDNDGDNDSESEVQSAHNSPAASARHARHAPAASSGTRSSTRVARAKAPKRQHQPLSDEDEDDDDDDDDDYESNSLTRKRTPARTPHRSARAFKRQRGLPSPISHDDSDDPSAGPSKRQRSPTKKSTTRKQRPQSRSKVQVEGVKDLEVAYAGVIPKWQLLPWHILQQVFHYASYPLYLPGAAQTLPSLQWLLGVSRLCHSFAEPALAVIYSSPPLVQIDKAHGLVALLDTNPKELSFGYRQKVTTLQIDVGRVATYTFRSKHLDLHDLIQHLPRLSSLELYDQKDMAPYRALEETIKWKYPDGLFAALEAISPDADPAKGGKTSICKLKSWRWSSRMVGLALGQEHFQKLTETHLRPSFAELQKLTFVNYQIQAKKKDEEDPDHEVQLADSLSVLKKLDHLVFEACSLANSKLLPLLPSNLRTLSFINCWEITSDVLGEFLLTHGRQLRTLTLNHNQALNLSFLPILAEACPYLEVFRMDLLFFDAHPTSSTHQPDFDVLLSSNQIPTWPQTLQAIELTNLRKWDQEASEVFLQSILDCAGKLPDLRVLVLSADPDLAWRERASFRPKWAGKLTEVFQRFSKPPCTAAEAQAMQINDSSDEEPLARRSKQRRLSAGLSDDSGRRRSSRAHAAKSYAESSDSSDQEMDPPKGQDTTQLEPSPKKRALSREVASLKLREGVFDFHNSQPLSPGTQSKEDIEEAKRARSEERDCRGQVIQGMCDVVSVEIGPLRPTGQQRLTEEDFLDGEASGDEDWDGDDVVDEVFAW